MNKKYIYCILLFLAGLLIQSCTNSVFSGGGTEPDILAPTLTIDSHVNNVIVNGTITLSGTALDDQGIKEVIIYESSIIDGNEKVSRLKKAALDQSNWKAVIDTTIWSDGGKIFKVIAEDHDGKEVYKSLTLLIDNNGPEVFINEPQAKASDVFYNTFKVNVTCLDTGMTTALTWELYNIDDPTIIYTEELTDLNVRLNYTFDADPGHLATQGFVSGECMLRVRALDDQGNYSTEWAEKKLYVDFGNDRPLVYLTTPEAIEAGEARIFGSKVSVSGSAVDDDGIDWVEIRYKGVNEADSQEKVVRVTDDAKSKQFFYHAVLDDLVDGRLYQVKTISCDINNSLSMASELHYFKINSGYPTLSIIEPDVGSWYKGDVTVDAVARSPAGKIVTFMSSYNGVDWTTHYENTLGLPEYTYQAVLDTTGITTTDGTVNLFFRITDDSGVTVDENISFIVDNMAPTVGITSPITGNTGLNQDVLIQGTAGDEIVAGVTASVKSVSLRMSAPGYDDVTADPEGLTNWSYTYDTSAIDAAAVTLTVTVTDLADNTTAVERVLNIDQAADIPIITLTSLAENDKLFGSVNVKGTADDDDNTAEMAVQVKIDDGLWEPALGKTSWTYVLDTTLYSDGPHTLYCRAIDKNGTPSTVLTRNFIIDPDAPVVTISSHFDGQAMGTTPEDTTIIGKVIKSKGVISEVKIKPAGVKRSDGSHFDHDWIIGDPGTTVNGFTINKIGGKDNEIGFEYHLDTSFWADGTVDITISARDDTNKLGLKQIELILDTAAPDTVILKAPLSNTQVTGNSVILKGSCEDPAPSSGLSASGVRAYVDDGAGYSATIIDGSIYKISTALADWTYQWDITSTFPDGRYDITLEAVDKAGNATISAPIENIHLMRYPPSFKYIKINDTLCSDDVSNALLVTDTIEITGNVTDNNIDKKAHVNQVTIYLSNDPVYDAADEPAVTTIRDADFTGTDLGDRYFSYTHTFTGTDKPYIIFKASDICGGYTYKTVQVAIDNSAPTFSATYYPEDTLLADAPGYSAILRIRLTAADNNDLPDQAINAKLVNDTAPTVNLLDDAYLNSGDIIEYDVKLHHVMSDNPTFKLLYSVKDKAGNVTPGEIPIGKANAMPVITTTSFDDEYLGPGDLAISGTVTMSGATVARLSFLTANTDITDYTYEQLTVLSNCMTGPVDNWAYTIPAGELTAGENNTIYCYVQADNGVNWYEAYSFTYDNSAPIIEQYRIEEIDDADVGRKWGDWTGDNKRISGTIRFTGEISDDFGKNYHADDIRIRLLIDKGDAGNETEIIIQNGTHDYIIKEENHHFTWTYDWDTSKHPAGVDGNVVIEATVYDAVGNHASSELAGIIIAPYLTGIAEVDGVVSGVLGDADNNGQWQNDDDKKTYSYRMGAGDITLTGFNLASSTIKTYYHNTLLHTINNDSSTDLIFSMPGLAAQKNGALYVSIDTLDSNEKDIYVVENYQAANYKGLVPDTADMLIDKDGYAHVVVQKKWNGANGFFSGLYTFKEVNNAHNLNRPALQATNFISQVRNKFLMTSVTRDASPNKTLTQNDDTYYILYDDAEIAADHASGLQLMGSNDWWQSPGSFYKAIDHDYINHPQHDHILPSGTPTNDSESQLHAHRDRWRMGAIDDLNDAYQDWDDDDDLDWNVVYGNVVAADSIVHTVYYDLFERKMKYRLLDNKVSSSSKLPNGGPLDFGIDGQYPAITLEVDNTGKNGKPVIVCFNNDTGKLTGYKTTQTKPQIPGHFNTVIEITGGNIIKYPDIKIFKQGATSYYHLVYQDKTDGELIYTCATSFTGLATSPKVVLDTEASPGMYCHLELSPHGHPIITYLAEGYINTKNAVRVLRLKGIPAGQSPTTIQLLSRTNWERLILPCENDIRKNKVRGYLHKPGATASIISFGMSDVPEFFREQIR